MIGSVSARYAVRSLTRQPKRTILSVVGVGVGCAMSVFAAAWMRGGSEMQIRAASESGAGHLRIVHRDWPELRRNTLRLKEWPAALEAARSLPGVRHIAVRARTSGLLAFGNRSAGVEITGVDPRAERVANRVVYKSSITGRYLEPDDVNAVVIGRALAQRLDVEVDDDLYATLAGKEEIQSVMLRIVGLIDTGVRDLDAAICHVNWRDVERITGYAGPGDISMLLDDYRLLDARREELAAAVPAGNTVVTWREVNPDIAGNVEGDRAFTRGILAAIVAVVMLGIASAQMTSVLERRREFAVLSALGMRTRQVVALMGLEGLLVGLAGTAVALGIGGSAAYYISTHGVNLAAFMGSDFTFGNALFDPYMQGDFGTWIVWHALGVCVAATLLAFMYPAWLATRTDPADALRTV
jgi:ABC-type lipoprotein release transport system permease subunit